METLAKAITEYYVMGKYKDGYFVWMEDNYDSNNQYTSSTFGYYQNGQIQWEKDIYYYNKFLSEGTAIEYNNLLIFINYDIHQDPILITINEKGEILEENSIAEYFPNIENYDYYNFEHIIKGKSGFYITGSYVFKSTDGGDEKEDEDAGDDENQDADESDDGQQGKAGQMGPDLDARVSQSAPMYFSKYYNIMTKTTGNGKVEASKGTAINGETITFTVTPEKGYVLGVLKVTDSNGNTITFTSNTFTMPYADVTIEAIFVPENPDTKDIAIAVVLVLALICAIIAIINKKKFDQLKV